MRLSPFFTFILLPALLALAACKPTEPPPAQLEPPQVVLPDSIRQLNPAAVQALLNEQPRLQVIDCRMEEEYHHGRLPGAYHVNFFNPDETRQRLQTLDPARPSLIYCTFGTRSAQTALLMQELGFQDIILLDGGIHAWLTAKLPLVR